MAKVKKTSSKRAPCWTAEEDAVLREGYRQKLPLRSIAAQLGRTVTAVYQRARAVAATQRLCRKWRTEDDEYLTYLYLADRPASEIARRLDRTRYAVAERAQKLGLVQAKGRSRGRSVLTTGAGAERVKLLHAAGLSNRDIAREMGLSYPWKDPETQIYCFLKRRGLASRRNPPEVTADLRRESAARAWASYGQACGDLAARYGLPRDLSPRQVQIVAILSGGPMTGLQVRRAMGSSASLHREGGHESMGGLIRRGLIAYVRGEHAGRRGPRPGAFFLTARAMEMLTNAGKGGAA